MSTFRFYNEQSLLTAGKLLKNCKIKMPETAVVVWYESFNEVAFSYGAKPVWTFNCGIKVPVYNFVYDNTEFAYACIPVGSPVAAAFIEEMAVLGTKNFVFIGSCGVLDQRVGTKLVVPEKALCGVGTACYYKTDEGDFTDIKTASVTASFLESLDLPYITGAVWSTDAMYRETPSAIKSAKEQGCVCVDMECAAISAVSKFKGVNSYQIMFSADRLTGSEWEKGLLHIKSGKSYETYFDIALRLAVEL